MKKQIFLLSLLLLPLALSAATALPDGMRIGIQLLRCGNCDARQMSGLALSRGIGARFIYDVANNALRLIEVSAAADGAAAPTAHELPVPTSVATGFNTYHELYLENGRSENFAVSLREADTRLPGIPALGGEASDDGYMNAFDTLIVSAYNTMLLEQIATLASDQHGDTLTKRVLHHVLTGVIAPQDRTLVVRVMFHDGSQREYGWDAETLRLRAEPGSAIDAHRNTLPEGDATPSQQYTFTTGVGVDAARYDSSNIAAILTPGATPAVQGCAALGYDGEHLTCITPHSSQAGNR